ncbi:hypothetical protein [Desulfolutivibrio sp.]|uniref:hypothetical protein n=1 Tax=Desulfolutivibrio sp. TaxID=2773296 RepID=UPI002F96E390
MLKQLMAFLAAMAILAAGVSYAAPQAFSKYALDIPEGWTFHEDGNVVAIFGPHNVAAISIVMDTADGMTARSIAEAMSGPLQGTTPRPTHDGYVFTFQNDQGVDSFSRISVANGIFVMVTVTGDHPQVAGILGSIVYR